MTAENNPKAKHYLTGWIPVAFDQEQKRVSWVNGSDKDFHEPFFEDTLKMLRRIDSEMASTSLEELIRRGKQPLDIIKPTAFIFHVSRCGSTLITQMLAQSNKNIVYSEPPLLDEILAAEMDEDKKIETIKATIALLGQKRKASHRYLFIKWDSWHLAYYTLIKNTFPHTPCIFLYREPLAVLKSHYHIRGMHMVPGLLKADVFCIKNIPVHDLNAYAASVLSKLYEWMMLYCADDNTRLINYDQLPEKLFDIIRDQNLQFTSAELHAMLERTRKHSKQPLDNVKEKCIEKDQLVRLKGLALAIREGYDRLNNSPSKGA